MAGSILFVQENKNFLLNAVASGLEKNYYSTQIIFYDLDEFRASLSKYDSLFFLVTENTKKDYCELLEEAANHSEKKIYILGDKDTVDAVATSFEGAKCFYKPANAKDIVAEICGTQANSDGTETTVMKRILVVDDSGTFLHTVKSWLGPYYNVTVVNSAAMGLSYLSKNKTDLILLDYEMPECSGPEMLEKLRESSELNEIPVIFLSGKGDRESITNVLSYKTQGYLLKSYPKEKILETVDEFFKNN